MTTRIRLFSRVFSSGHHAHRTTPSPPLPKLPPYLNPLNFFRLRTLRTARIITFTVLKFFFIGHFITEHTVTYAPTGGPSMLPTLSVKGDAVLLAKYYRRGRGVKVGDVVSFKHPLMPEVELLKRVAGMPGDFVCTGEKVGRRGEEGMIQVPEGHCWVLGDNLPDSRDSRLFGPLPLALIGAKGVARVRPLTEICWLGNTLQPPEEAC